MSPDSTQPSTQSSRHASAGSTRRVDQATAAVHAARVSTHSSMEPSWLPHIAETR